MTFIFTTAKRNIDSSLVEDAWYNAGTHEAVLSLHGWAYKYSGVGPADFSSLVEANSVGSAYAYFKQDFGPAESLGRTATNQFVAEVAKVGAPQNWTLSPNAVVSDNTSTGSIAASRIDLAPVEALPAGKEYEYSLNFDVEGGAQNKSYGVKAAGIEQAVEALTEIADMLGIAVKVTSATVYFD